MKNYNKKFKTLLTNKIVTFDDLYKNIMDGAETEDRLPTDHDLECLITYDHTNAQAKGLNKSIKNREFEIKKSGTAGNNGYNKYALGLKTFDFSLYDEWNEASIDTRLDTLLDQIKTVWPYGNAR